MMSVRFSAFVAACGLVVVAVTSAQGRGARSGARNNPDEKEWIQLFNGKDMSGKLRLERTAVDLREIVQGAVAVVQPVIDAKRIEVVVDASSSLGTVFADSSRLQQVVWNLLSNAVKYTPEAGIVRVRLNVSGSTAEMVVEDSGEGIPPEFLPHVFEPFRQADASTTRTHAGLGLGLSIVRQIVEAHGGHVSAQNATDHPGAVITVRLPIVAVRPHRRASDVPVSSAFKDENALADICVLVVDDDDEGRQVVAAHLESCHAQVLTAASAPEAIDVLRKHQVHVLLADIAMPSSIDALASSNWPARNAVLPASSHSRRLRGYRCCNSRITRSASSYLCSRL